MNGARFSGICNVVAAIILAVSIVYHVRASRSEPTTGRYQYVKVNSSINGGLMLDTATGKWLSDKDQWQLSSIAGQ